MEKIEEAVVETKHLETKMDTVLEQHSTLVKNVSALSMLQQDIAKQIVQQHQDVEALYLALGLKKDLSYYSFNITNMEEH